MNDKIPGYVTEIIKKIEQNSFEAFVVGGCVRDLLLGKEPKDWDIATSAKPEEIQKIFPNSVYENQFGTVGIKIKKTDETNGIVEVTTYRIESKYSDKRHPDEIKFAKNLREDLSRRDFTVNAMALRLKNENLKTTEILTSFEIIDPFNGQNDLKNEVIRAVGKADERFDEDALRMMRAVRFAVQIGFEIEKNTFNAIRKNHSNLKHISQERVRDEFIKIILSSQPAKGIRLLYGTGLLFQFIPEIKTTVGVKQGKHHLEGPYHEVFDHLVGALEKCPSKKLEVRLACLFHDIGKPQTKRGQGANVTFYNHQYVSAKITREILGRLKFSREITDKTVLLVHNHMFYYNVDEVGESGVRRVIRNVGLDNINDLIDVRIGDRLGSGVAKAVPYKLRHFRYMVEKLSHDPISVRQLKINGSDLMKELQIKPGPKIGAILDILLFYVIENPKSNDKNKLLKMAKNLNKQEIESLRNAAKEKIRKEQEIEDKRIKKAHWVE